MLPDIKKCSRCEKTKPARCFYIRHRGDTAFLSPRCNPCERERRLEYYYRTAKRKREVWHWSPEDLEILKALYPLIGPTSLMKLTGWKRSKRAVQLMAYRIGVYSKPKTKNVARVA